MSVEIDRLLHPRFGRDLHIDIAALNAGPGWCAGWRDKSTGPLKPLIIQRYMLIATNIGTRSNLATGEADVGFGRSDGRQDAGEGAELIRPC